MKFVNRPATPAEQADMGVDVPQVNCPYCQDRVGGCTHCDVCPSCSRPHLYRPEGSPPPLRIPCKCEE